MLPYNSKAIIPPAAEAPAGQPKPLGAQCPGLRSWHRPTLTEVPLQVTGFGSGTPIDLAQGSTDV
jgi:hypothetical protein